MKTLYRFNIVFVILVISLLCLQRIVAQEIRELTGEVIYFDRCNETTNPVRHVFDNKTSTFFNSCSQFGNWIGLDLGEKHVITKVAYAPRMDADYRERLQLGVFQGANQPDFGDAIALFIIPGLTERMLNEREIVCTRAFRYVRFIFPTPQQAGKSSYLSELKFFGYTSEGNDSKLPQLTALPTVSVHTDNNQDITSKVDYVKGIISVIYADGTKIQSDSLQIRGRGNNSWTYPKKPYRIKLYNSTKLMGLPAKAKNWTLINNYGDKTLMRNMIAFDFSRRLEMTYTSPAEAVDLIVNGDYKGCYQLCDHIDVRENRVNIEEMNASGVTGGYMIEIDAYAYPDEPKKFTSNRYRIPVTIKYPDSDEITIAQESYIESHFNKFTSAVYSQNKDSVRRYTDIESFLRHFLVGEFSGNTDTYWSVRMSKKRDDDKFYFGPVWDFDLGFENDWRTYPINQKAWTTQQWVCLSSGSSAAGETKTVVSRLIADADHSARLKEIYSYYRDKGDISKEAVLGVVDAIAARMDASQQLNFKRWPIMNTKVHENPVIYGSYTGEVNNVRNYISDRFDWMDYKLSYVPTLTSSDFIRLPELRVASSEGAIRIMNVTESYIISIVDITGRMVVSNRLVTEDQTLAVDKGIYIVVATNEKNISRSYKCIVP